VMIEACRQMHQLQERYRGLSDLGVSVNVSNKEFTLPGLANAVNQALRRSALPARSLRLEITEKVLIGNLRLANRLFSELSSEGIRFDIDDFGTGYSALTYLQNFPIHALKIDQSFIDGMGRSRKALGLVKAIISMAHELGMRAVAEGVSTAGQYQDLKELQCDYVQGNLLSKPIKADALLHYLDQSPTHGRRAAAASAAPQPAGGNGSHPNSRVKARPKPASVHRTAKV
ncbi:MAG TPA: EAL domain-containing protein, partial [Anaerolineales bacterium]|nr:EAL domain-containing protein [Anaerolineales bacterium]